MAPAVPIRRVEIVWVLGDYAIVAVFLEPGVADPAGIILRHAGGAWPAVAGPGTAFPPGSRGGAPNELFEFGPPPPAAAPPN